MLLVIAVVLVTVLFLISAFFAVFYYSEAQGASSQQRTTTTLTVVETAPGSVISLGNFTSLGFNPQLIYNSTNRGIVTVQGTQTSFSGLSQQSFQVLGSGFVVAYLGQYYIVTNYHVVVGDSNLTVTFSDGNGYSAKVIGSDPYADIAVVVVNNAPAREFYPLNVTTSSKLKVGEPVIAIGNPFGLTGSLTFGVVSQLGRTIQDPTAGNYSIADAIQFSAPINPGNSGGPLLDGNGAVVGVTTATISSSQGVNFAISSDTVLRELPSLVLKGSYTSHPLMGIEGYTMSYQLAQVEKTNFTYGVLVASVLPGGPAANGGLRGGNTTVTIDGTYYTSGGDVIVAINGTKILNIDALSSYLEENAVPGQIIFVTIIRSGVMMYLNVTVGTRPPPTSG